MKVKVLSYALHRNDFKMDLDHANACKFIENLLNLPQDALCTCGRRFHKVEGEEGNLCETCREAALISHHCGIEGKEGSLTSLGTDHISNTHSSQIYVCEICQVSFKSANDLRIHYSSHPKCDICDRHFITKSQLEDHYCFHSSSQETGNISNANMDDLEEEEKYICDICKVGFPQKCSLWIHQRIHEGQKLYECTICPRKFTNKSFHIKHYQSHKIVATFPCNICNKKFASKLGLQNHHSIDHRTGNSSQIGNKTLTNESTFEQNLFALSTSVGCETSEDRSNHMGQTQVQAELSVVEKLQGDIKDKKHKCNICEKSFTHKHVLKRHSYTHLSKKPYACDICDKSFTHFSRLKEHFNIHTGETYSCSICEKGFASKNGLNKHMLKHIGVNSINPQDYEDNIDTQNKSTDVSTRDGLLFHHFVQQWEHPQSSSDAADDLSDSHISEIHDLPKSRSCERSTSQIQLDKNRFKCHLCEKAFPYRCNLKKHLTIHTRIAQKPRVCEICNKSFSTDEELQDHHRSAHPVEMPNACDMCQKSFVLKQSLKFHYKQFHTNDKPHKCDICGKSFMYKHVLKRHEITHEYEKQYECKVCHKKLATKSSLKDHSHVHKDIKPFACDVCDAQFTTVYGKRQHYRVFHENANHELTIHCENEVVKCSTMKDPYENVA